MSKTDGTEEAPGVFARQVLDRIASRPTLAPSRMDYWRPLAALAVLVVSLILLPHQACPGLPDFASSARALPEWALALGRDLPGDAVSAWDAGQIPVTLPTWLWSALPAAALLNWLCFALSRRRSLS